MSDTSRIQSHSEPRRYLKQHVAEIVAAGDVVLAQHGLAAWRDSGQSLLDELARLHDLGKASAPFQAYIANPAGWRGNPRDKAHTLLSLVLATAWGQAAALDGVRMVSLALAVRGHHGGQPSSDATVYGRLQEDDERAVLCAQLATLDRDALAAEVAVTLPPLDDPEAVVRRAIRTLRGALDTWRRLALPEMVGARFVARAAYSVLLETDKAFLAIEKALLRAYLHRERPALSTTLVDMACESLPNTPMDALRMRARELALEGFARSGDAPLLTLTLPTGAGKTLIAAQWALAERSRGGGTCIDAPMVIVALPMLSIVDQTERVWRNLLRAGDADGDTLLPFHSLSERMYDPELPEGTAEFFIDTWRSEVVVTTFDQLLLALYSDRAKHAMRFHRLLNARIVIDEVQCLPPVLWKAVSEGLAALTRLGRTRVLAMSATPSPCIEGATEVLDDPAAIYRSLSRYELRLEHETRVDFDRFIAAVTERCRAHRDRDESTLVTVNLRATARETWDQLDAAGLQPLLLSGDMTPAHRLRVIDSVKGGHERVVVSTQCVEAGVDVDMDHVIRDLAPLDALVQIAGRCNRHARRDVPGTVTVVHLSGPDGRDNAQIIYDEVLLQCTREVLRGREVIPEREVLAFCQRWFSTVAQRKYQGGELFSKWARVEAALDVRKLLRGEDEDQRRVLVTEHDASLLPAIRGALAMPDRWERRSALRALSAQIARHTVSVAAKVCAALSTRPIGSLDGWYELLPGQYHRDCGIDSRRRA